MFNRKRRHTSRCWPSPLGDNDLQIIGRDYDTVIFRLVKGRVSSICCCLNACFCSSDMWRTAATIGGAVCSYGLCVLFVPLPSVRAGPCKGDIQVSLRKAEDWAERGEPVRPSIVHSFPWVD